MMSLSYKRTFQRGIEKIFGGPLADGLTKFQKGLNVYIEKDRGQTHIILRRFLSFNGVGTY